MRRRFHVAHLKDAKFARRGLRGYFEYRDLGIGRASGGEAVAQVIRARPQEAPHGEWHTHDCRNIRHREIRHSKDLEMIEVVSPANFKTRASPEARKSPARRSRG